MTLPTLTYFDFDGGRGEPIRLALTIAAIDFEDDRFAMSEFATVRKTTPFGQVPTFTLGSQQITQTNAILRYVGKLSGLYPEDPIQGLLCDEAMDVIEDTINKVVATFGLQGDELKAAREALLSGPYTVYLNWLNERLDQQGGHYFVGNTLTIADLKVWVFLQTLMAGMFEYIAKDWVSSNYPALANYVSRIANVSEIKEYYAGR